MPFTMMKEGMHQSNALIYLITIAHFRLLGCIDLAFPYLSERVIIIKAMIMPIIKSVSSKL